MNIKQAENEMNYRIIKIVLSTMLTEGLISKAEFERARKKLVNKLKPLIGSLEEPE
jgi:hypothetical protein